MHLVRLCALPVEERKMKKRNKRPFASVQHFVNVGLDMKNKKIKNEPIIAIGLVFSLIRERFMHI